MRKTIQEEILRCVRRLCRERGQWTFRTEEVVLALPHLNASSVRTHVGSRCCVNAPKNHPHKWDYFRRVGRGLYELRSAYRKERPGTRSTGSGGSSQSPGLAAEPQPRYQAGRRLTQRAVIHAAVFKEDQAYVAECLEIAVVTQGRTMDEVLDNLKEAIALHLEGEDPETLGLSPSAHLVVTYELPLQNVFTA